MFERAEPDDVGELVALRDRVARWLLERGVEQWLPGEFSVSRMQGWVERGDVFVGSKAFEEPELFDSVLFEKTVT